MTILSGMKKEFPVPSVKDCEHGKKGLYNSTGITIRIST